MPASIQHENNDLYTLCLTGVLKQSEFADTQTAIGHAIENGTKPRLLALLENFQGWERGADWNYLDFLFKHSNEIERIAIVGHTEWEPKALAFAGAGVRRASVKFFPSGQLEEARQWLVK